MRNNTRKNTNHVSEILNVLKTHYYMYTILNIITVFIRDFFLSNYT